MIPTTLKNLNKIPTYQTSSGTIDNMKEEISIINLRFVPNKIRIPRGSALEFKVEDSLSHTFKIESSLFESPYLSSGDRYSYQFAIPGEFTVFSRSEPSLECQVSVEGSVVSSKGAPSSEFRTTPLAKWNRFPLSKEEALQKQPLEEQEDRQESARRRVKNSLKKLREKPAQLTQYVGNFLRSSILSHDIAKWSSNQHSSLKKRSVVQKKVQGLRQVQRSYQDDLAKVDEKVPQSCKAALEELVKGKERDELESALNDTTFLHFLVRKVFGCNPFLLKQKIGKLRGCDTGVFDCQLDTAHLEDELNKRTCYLGWTSK